MDTIKLIVFLSCLVVCAGCKQENSIVEKKGSASVPDTTFHEKMGIAWLHNLPEALARAKKENKPVMADFTAEWCGWCKKLDKNVFTDPDLIALSAHFVSTKVNTDKYPEESRKYRIQGLPTILFFNAQGEVINQIVGYQDADGFINVMKQVLKS